MGILTIITFSLALITIAQCKLQCSSGKNDIPKEWVTLADTCTEAMSKQVQIELNAAMTYMAMGAHFSKDVVNRPGFADFFFKSASEEREHAMKILGYLLMRGGLTKEITRLIRDPKPQSTTWESAVHALRNALELETKVTRKIRGIIQACESPAPDKDNAVFNDYHLVDYLTGEFLTEQYEGQRELAGMISTLGKMMDGHGQLGEFLYDKKLLNQEVAV